MTEVPTRTVYQQLACVKKTGHVFLIKPFEEVLMVSESDTQVVVTIKYFVLTERRGGFKVEQTGVRLIGFIKSAESGKWAKSTISVADDQPDFDFVRTYGPSITPQLHRDRIDWARLCANPGTPSHPLHSAHRTDTQPELSTRRMTNHWSAR